MKISENDSKNLDNHWIIKAWNLAHGTSTKIVKSLAEIMTMRKTITPYTISKYIERPFLERLHIFNGAKKLLCGNVRNFSMTKNGCAHRVQHTRISLGPNFGASSSLIFKDF